MASCSLFYQVPAARGESVHIHKYKGADGTWRFTDTYPDTSQDIGPDADPDINRDTDRDTNRAVQSQEALTSTPRPKIRLSRESDGQGDVIYAHNDYMGPVEVMVRFISAENVDIVDTAIFMAGDHDDVRNYILPRSGKQAVFAVKPTKFSRPSRYKFTYRYLPGDPRATPDDQFNYLAPIAPGARFPITQAFNGPFSHQGRHNRYAVDIAMPVETPIHCARTGMVMEVMDDYFWAGKNLTYYGPRSNLIRILHDDGTMALYAHLWRGSAVVKAGQRVNAGEMIARSGNTGYSSGPHLHFSVLINQGMEVVSVPFQFKGAGGSGITPVRGFFLTHNK